MSNSSLTSFRSIIREASRDKEFAAFLETFKKNHAKNFKKVIDMRTEEQAAEAFEKTMKERDDDVEMAEEFRKRRLVQKLYGTKFDSEMSAKDKQLIEHRVQKSSDMIQIFRDQKRSKLFVQPKRGRPPKPLRHRLYNVQDAKFTIIFLHADYMTNVTRLKRISHRRVLIFLGNREGIIGYGRGIGVDYEAAYISAIEDAKKNLLIVKRDPLHTWPQYTTVRFNGIRIKMYANKGGHIWGNLMMCWFLRLTGIFHGAFRILCRKPTNMFPFVYAYILLMSKNQLVTDIIEKTGDKVYSYNIGLSSHSQHSGLV